MATASSYRPPRKSAVRWINGVGRALGAIGVPVARLDAEHLLRKASRSTGLDDFGDSAFREPLERYVRALEEEARLTPVGRLINQRELIRILENRLLMIEERKRHPEIGEERIEAPLFVLGLPRTGTTILHELLAQDPENRCPMTWEVMWPIPRPRAESFETDPRIARVDGYLKAVDSLIPGFRKMHPMGARLPQECVMLMNHDFMSMQFYCSNRVPSYEDWLEAQDHEPAYRAHRRYLQLLQSLAPARYWALKSPQHLWHLDALLRVYPDARLVQTHRDPVKVAASLASLVSLLRGMASDDVDPEEVGADWAARMQTGLERTMEVRSALPDEEERVLDLYFKDFMTDPITSVRAVYRHWGRSLSDEAEGRMRAHLSENPRGKYGRHEYTLDGYGMNLEDERKRFDRYQSRYAIPEETT